jgi:hypothetical protein
LGTKFCELAAKQKIKNVSSINFRFPINQIIY